MVHFLLVAYPVQGHINPGIQLSNRLATTVDALITFSTTTYAHRRLFPRITSPDQAVEEGPITYHPFNDGNTDILNSTAVESVSKCYSELKENGSQSISSLLDTLHSTGRTVDCVLYTFMLPWVAEIAVEHEIPSAEYWIQPATVFAQYYHAFSQDFHKIITENASDPYSVLAFPGMPPFQIRDLSSILNPNRSSNPISNQVILLIKEAFTSLKPKKKVLVNTCEGLERDTIAAISDVDLIAIGPVLQNLNSDGDQFRPEEAMYMQWLDSKKKNSVVYISFGSIAVLKREQVEEVLKGLKANGRPYLMVLRNDSRYEGIGMEEEDESGMIVSWCSQVNVLRHPSVGCFVTHCGWNSTLESIVCGVPMVGVPQWLDQYTNAMLVDKVWGVGVRGEESESGLFEGEELNRCIELVLGDSERRVRIRKNVEVLKKSAMEAVKEGGSSDRNLKAFVHEISNK